MLNLILNAIRFQTMSYRLHLFPNAIANHVPSLILSASSLRVSLLFLLTISFTGCAFFPSPSQKAATVFSNAILNNNDLQIVKDGAPAYLLLLEALVAASPKSEGILLAASKLNGAYAGAFTTEPKRIQILSDKSFSYAQRAFCSRKQNFCELQSMSYEDFNDAINQTKAKDINSLYTVGVAWAGWIQAHSDDWNAVADLAKVKAIMNRVIAIDEAYDGGGAHLYLGVLDTLVPPSLGGKPEEGRKHFEKAIALCDNTNLMYKVVYAEQYARLVFDRDLHDRLLNQVLEASPVHDGLTLINTLAQQKAELLLASGDEYF